MRPLATLVLTAALVSAAPAPAQKAAHGASSSKPIVWADPGDIRSRDLSYGVGGKKNLPSGPFTYVREDKGGTSAKFEVTDGAGSNWKGKFEPESQSEVVASRLLWAVGYSANENYYFENLPVPGIRQHQKRGREFITRDDVAHKVRLQRNPPHEKKGDQWSWRDNPLKGTREFNGLRVMMALLNNWDLKDDNNAIYEDKDHSREIYGVTDVGATFGTSGKSYTEVKSKNNLKAYRKNKFIAKVTPEYVDFNFPTHPAILHYFPLFEFKLAWHYCRTRWVGRHIPRQDVKWVASLLTQLSPDQIHDAFRAAGYTPEQVEAFSAVVQGRIAELAKL